MYFDKIDYFSLTMYFVDKIDFYHFMINFLTILFQGPIENMIKILGTTKENKVKVT